MSDKNDSGNGGDGEGNDGPAGAPPDSAVPDELDIPVEVDAFDQTTRPVAIPDLKRGEPAVRLPGAVAEVESADRERIAQLEMEKKEVYDRLLRSAADLENLRKRSRREVEDTRVDSRSKVLKEMLPVIDNLERAVAHAESNAESGPVIEGVKLVLRQFFQALERFEVGPVEAEGLAFDPGLHEAISQMETADAAPGTVVSVLQKGYRIGQRLLRPALVVVARAPSLPVAETAPAEPVGSGSEEGE